MTESISVFIYDSKYREIDPNTYKLYAWNEYYYRYYNLPLEERWQIKLQEIDSNNQIPGKYNTITTLAKSGYRVTPLSENLKEENIERETLFLGCSFVFGTGVEDYQTLPFHYQSLLSNEKAYNLGVGGYGPTENLAHMMNIDKIIDDDLHEAPTAIFVFFDDHIMRTTLGMSHMMWTTIRSVQVPKFNDNDEIIGVDYLRNVDPLRYFLFTLMQTSRFIRILFLELAEENNPTDIKRVYAEEDINYTLKVIEKTQKEFYKRFPKGKFYVFNLQEYSYPFSEQFKKHNLNVINKARYDFDPKRLKDGHFSDEGNKFFAQYLYDILKTYKAD